MQIKAKIKVSVNWSGMSGMDRNSYLREQLHMLASQVGGWGADKKTILNRNGNTSHIEVKM